MEQLNPPSPPHAPLTRMLQRSLSCDATRSSSLSFDTRGWRSRRRKSLVEQSTNWLMEENGRTTRRQVARGEILTAQIDRPAGISSRTGDEVPGLDGLLAGTQMTSAHNQIMFLDLHPLHLHQYLFLRQITSHPLSPQFSS